MSKRHQASRRRTYGRRQHEIRERRERTWRRDRDGARPRRRRFRAGRGDRCRPPGAGLRLRLARARVVAGYAGARPRSGLLGRRGAGPSRRGTVEPRAGVMPRRRISGGSAARARQRSGRTGLVVAAIIVVFALGLVSLSQTVRVSANGLERRSAPGGAAAPPRRAAGAAVRPQPARARARRPQARPRRRPGPARRPAHRPGPLTPMLGRTDSRPRTLLLLALLLVFAAACVVRLGVLAARAPRLAGRAGPPAGHWCARRSLPTGGRSTTAAGPSPSPRPSPRTDSWRSRPSSRDGEQADGQAGLDRRPTRRDPATSAGPRRRSSASGSTPARPTSSSPAT